MKRNKELDNLVDELMPKRYYGHEARRYAKVIALRYHEMKKEELISKQQ